MNKEYVVMWNQENNMGIPLLVVPSAERVTAENKDEAIEKVCLRILTRFSSEYEYMIVTVGPDDNGNLEVEITNEENDDFYGRLYDFVALCADDE